MLYSDATPSVTNSYDRLGRLTQQATADYQITSTYNLAGELLTEAYTGGPLAGLAITNGYDQFLRRTNLTARQVSTLLSQQSFGFDQSSRLQTVKDSTGNAVGYSYVANSGLVEQIGFTNGSAPRMTTTKAYDYLNRLTAIASTPAASAAVNFNYNYNAANQRTKNTLVDGSYWVYQYDTLGQVTSGKKYFADGTGVPGQEFDYSFDDIGNRKQTKAGGDSAGSGLRLATYAVNKLNQITSRDYPGTNDVVGVALATNGVTVNGQTAWRKGEYFWSTVGTNNAGGARWLGVMVASGGTTNQGNLFVAKTPEQFQYDADGNLTNDGHWAYMWDAENRLVRMTVNTNVGPQLQLTFGYDAKSRRIQKVVTSNSIAISTNKFLYDGWNVVAELKPNNALVRRYTWGTDLSGSMQGAGGVGGLLAVSYYGTATTNCFVAYDGNGNVAALVNAADGTLAANYEYAAFGEVIRISGAMAKANPFRFSTKYTDDESDLLCYGLRFYRPSTGAWLSRDPIEENGGIPLYVMVGNHPLQSFDRFGLIPVDDSPIPTDIQTSDQGVGPLVERMYVVNIFNSTKTGKEIVEKAKTDINYFVGTPFLRYFAFAAGLSPNYLAVGNIYQIAGPGVNPYVKVVNADGLSWTFVTMKGHPEAGTITFRANDTSCGEIDFTIRSKTRAATLSDWFVYTFPIPLVGPTWDAILHGDLDPRGTGYRGLGYAVQTSIWTHFLHRVVDYSAGRQIGDIWYMDRWNF